MVHIFITSSEAAIDTTIPLTQKLTRKALGWVFRAGDFMIASFNSVLKIRDNKIIRDTITI